MEAAQTWRPKLDLSWLAEPLPDVRLVDNWRWYKMDRVMAVQSSIDPSRCPEFGILASMTSERAVAVARQRGWKVLGIWREKR